MGEIAEDKYLDTMVWREMERLQRKTFQPGPRVEAEAEDTSDSAGMNGDLNGDALDGHRVEQENGAEDEDVGALDAREHGVAAQALESLRDANRLHLGTSLGEDLLFVGEPLCGRRGIRHELLPGQFRQERDQGGKPGAAHEVRRDADDGGD